MNNKIYFAFIILLMHTGLIAQTIAEKKAGLGFFSSDLSEEMQQKLNQVNFQLEDLQKQLTALHKQAWTLYVQQAPECSYREILEIIQQVKQQKFDIETQWRQLSTQNQLEAYALWHQPESTLEQLVIDYGSQDYVYLIPPDLAEIPVSVNSNIPIPHSSWEEMLETILAQSGVGVKQLNPFLRQLYSLKEDHSGLKIITNNRNDLHALPVNTRIGFVLTPEPSDVRRVWLFLERFSSPQSVFLQLLGRDILIVAQVCEVQELLKLYDFVSMNRGDRDYKLITLSRIDAVEVAKILNAVFGTLTQEPKQILLNTAYGAPPPPRGMPPFPTNAESNGEENGIRIIPLARVASAIFLIGTKEEIRKAECLIREIEEQVGESRGKVVYRYAVKHSDAEELAEVLSKIYMLLITTGAVNEQDLIAARQAGLPPPPPPTPEELLAERPTLRRPFDEAFFLDDRYILNKEPPLPLEPVNQNRDNFIVDMKTGSIIMVVEADILPKMKEIVRKLDVPKRMVQIDVLLFEKRLSRENNFGLNLLKIGSAATNTCFTGATFNLRPSILTPPGIFDFLLSRKSQHGVPAYDLSYRFLLHQEDVQINANPSVLAVNQTPALIEIADEISVSTGIFEVPTINGVTLKDQFARAQYGIKINIIPTIHARQDEEFPDFEEDYVTLQTDLTFQTFKPTINNRPDVTTRHIINEVRIPNGQSVILGGLRRRDSHENVEKIPFLGDIPGVGKLFSLNDLKDSTTEMFIFLTPRIIYDPVEDLERIKMMELCQRPGDIPDYLCRVSEAHEWEKNKLFQQSMMLLFGRPFDRCICIPGEYDGR